MHAQTEILFFRWVTLTERKWVIFHERRSVTRTLRATHAGSYTISGTRSVTLGRKPCARTSPRYLTDGNRGGKHRQILLVTEPFSLKYKSCMAGIHLKDATIRRSDLTVEADTCLRQILNGGTCGPRRRTRSHFGRSASFSTQSACASAS